jgi:hypothetical protein
MSAVYVVACLSREPTTGCRKHLPHLVRTCSHLAQANPAIKPINRVNPEIPGFLGLFARVF